MGKLVEIKTKETAASVEDFIDAVQDDKKRKGCQRIMEMMEKSTGAKPKMWGGSLIGFGNRIVKSPATGREVEWFIIGCSPRKANLVLYLGTSLDAHAEALKKLGKHKTGMGCLYINKLEDVDLKVLEGIIEKAAKS